MVIETATKWFFEENNRKVCQTLHLAKMIFQKTFALCVGAGVQRWYLQILMYFASHGRFKFWRVGLSKDIVTETLPQKHSQWRDPLISKSKSKIVHATVSSHIQYWRTLRWCGTWASPMARAFEVAPHPETVWMIGKTVNYVNGPIPCGFVLIWCHCGAE